MINAAKGEGNQYDKKIKKIVKTIKKQSKIMNKDFKKMQFKKSQSLH